MRRVLADQLERRLTAGPAASPSADSRQAEIEHLAELAQQLRSVAPVALVPRQAFRDELHSRLMTEAAELAVTPAEHTPPTSTGRAVVRPRFQRARRTLAGVVVTAVLGGGAAAVASTGAVPGDVLYGLKRTFEDVRMQLAGSDAAKAGAALGQARERLSEAEELALTTPAGVEGADTPELREALGDYASSSDEGIDLLLQHYADEGDPASLAEIDTFVRETQPLLERLRTETPASLHPVIDALIAALQGTAADLASTVAACGDPCTSLGLVAAELEPQQSTSVPNPLVPGDVEGLVPSAPLPVADPAAPSDGLIPGVGLPSLPGQSSTAPDVPPPVTDPLAPITGLVTPVTDPLLSPTPEPAPSPGLPCVIGLIGDCPG